MSPEYVCSDENGESARLWTVKSDCGFWQGIIARPADGILDLSNSLKTDLFSQEQSARDNAVSKFGLKIIDTWPPQHPDLSFYLGQLKSYLTFQKFKR